MADAVLSRGATSVTIPILEEAGNLAVARDIGKPNMRTPEVGREDVLVADHLSQSDVFFIAGVLRGSSAYSDAKTLAEDLVKPRATSGTPLQLDLSALPQHSTYDVAPIQESALTLNYVSTDWVVLTLQLVAVDSTAGGSLTTVANSSPDSGSGVKLTDGTNPVTLDTNVRVTRKVGRPGGELIPRTTRLPRFVDKAKPASDVWEIQASKVSISDAVTLAESLVTTRLGRSTLTLHFLDSKFGLDAYEVVPVGSQASRYLFQAGGGGVVNVPTLKLRGADSLATI